MIPSLQMSHKLLGSLSKDTQVTWLLSPSPSSPCPPVLLPWRDKACPCKSSRAAPAWGPSWQCVEVGSWVWDCEWGPWMGWQGQ